MEKIKIVTQNRVEKINNSFGEICQDYIREKEFIFEKGKIYGIVGEYGEGGELISAIMSGQVSIKNEIIYVDGEKLQDFKLKNISWYVGKKEYANFKLKRELTVRKALEKAVKEYQMYKSVEEIVEEFHLSPDRL